MWSEFVFLCIPVFQVLVAPVWPGITEVDCRGTIGHCVVRFYLAMLKWTRRERAWVCPTAALWCKSLQRAYRAHTRKFYAQGVIDVEFCESHKRSCLRDRRTSELLDAKCTDQLPASKFVQEKFADRKTSCKCTSAQRMPRREISRRAGLQVTTRRSTEAMSEAHYFARLHFDSESINIHRGRVFSLMLTCAQPARRVEANDELHA